MPPFPSTLPRRYVFLFILITVILLVTTLTSTSNHLSSRLPSRDSLSSMGRGSSLHPANWLPDIVSPFAMGGDQPAEWDEYGRCLFLSPFDALSDQEKARAEAMDLVTVSEGIVRSEPSIFTPPSPSSHSPPTSPPTDSSLLSSPNNLTSAKFGKNPSSNMVVENVPTLSSPILALLMRGERKWQDLVSKQSRTLEEAVREYQERWGRMPPKGFEKWWDFVKTHGVLLPDEFDAINEALLPFWAFAPNDMYNRNKEAESTKETFTLIVEGGKVELQWNDDYSRDTWWASRPRADAQINLMEPFLDKLPSFRATFTVHDQPSIMPPQERMKELNDLARKGGHTKILHEKDENVMFWEKACPKDTPVGRGETEDESPATFISSHLSAMDPCQHPSILQKHGMPLEIKNAESQPKPHTRIMPIFVPSRTVLHADIPITPIGKDGRRDDVGNDPTWGSKSGKMYWRGLATGLQHNKFTGARWRDSHRERLHSLANNHTEALQSVLVPVGSTGKAQEVSYTKAELNQYYMDVKMSGGSWQCDYGDGSCGEMDAEYEFASKDAPNRSNLFKYIFDTDGNAWSSRFPRLMASKGMVIKASIFPEWNTHTMPEWYAYVPSKMDYSDIYSILAFFRGTPKGKGGHDEVARRIASNGQCWVEKTWRREDMQAYMFRLYLEWARLMSLDRDTGKMDFVLPVRSTGA